MTRETKAHVALACLRQARELLKEIGAVRTLAKLRHTIKSAEGAVRAASYRDQRLP
jgi:hypothetical protein